MDDLRNGDILQSILHSLLEQLDLSFLEISAVKYHSNVRITREQGLYVPITKGVKNLYCIPPLPQVPTSTQPPSLSQKLTKQGVKEAFHKRNSSQSKGESCETIYIL